MTKGSLVQFLLGFLGGMVSPLASAENPAELLHYGDSLVVREGVLGPNALKEQARLDLQELCLIAHCTCAQNILGYHPVAKHTM